MKFSSKLIIILLIIIILITIYYNSIGISTDKSIDNHIKIIQNKINNAVERGYLEAFTTDNTNYINKPNLIKLLLFYKPECSYCKNFMNTWTRIINDLPEGTLYEEINCENDNKLASEYKITTVPTLILLVNNEIHTYIGNRSYNDINKFLRIYGVNLKHNKFENFYGNDDLDDNNLDDSKNNKNCPAVTFDKQIDLENDSYMYQIFNKDGQYGYVVGGYNDKLLTPFMAAYSTVDSYLSSLPNSNETLYECAQVYADNIINFGLCDNEQLDKILDFQKNIDNGTHTPRIKNTNYNSNTNIVNAIKKVCGL